MICAREKVNCSDAVVRTYSWGPEAQGASGTLRMIADNNGVYFPAYDSNGNVMGLVKASDGTVCAQYEYLPYGELVTATGTMASSNPIRFSTKYYDTEARLYYYGYRYYSPDMGRWLSRDPIEERGGLNLYAFVNNDPMNHWDLWGMWQDERINPIAIPDWRQDRGQPIEGFPSLSEGVYYAFWKYYLVGYWNLYAGINDFVDIGEINDLNRYRNAQDVKRFECEVRNNARNLVDCCAKDGTRWSGSYDRLVEGRDGLYIMGKGYLKGTYACKMKNQKVTCKIRYRIKDDFRDPLSIDSNFGSRLKEYPWQAKYPFLKKWPRLKQIGLFMYRKMLVDVIGIPYGLFANWEDEIDGCSKKEECP